MTENLSKINLKVGQIEISIEGPSDFVSTQYDKVEVHLKSFLELSTKIPAAKPVISNNNQQDSPEATQKALSGSLPDTFGEWLNKIPRETSDTDKAVLAGYFTQITSEQKCFRVRDVTKLLKEHSIKLSNPSTFCKGAVNSKKIFQHSKTGSESNYRVTRETEKEMKQLLQEE